MNTADIDILIYILFGLYLLFRIGKKIKSVFFV